MLTGGRAAVDVDVHRVRRGRGVVPVVDRARKRVPEALRSQVLQRLCEATEEEGGLSGYRRRHVSALPRACQGVCAAQGG